MGVGRPSVNMEEAVWLLYTRLKWCNFFSAVVTVVGISYGPNLGQEDEKRAEPVQCPPWSCIISTDNTTLDRTTGYKWCVIIYLPYNGWSFSNTYWVHKWSINEANYLLPSWLSSLAFFQAFRHSIANSFRQFHREMLIYWLWAALRCFSISLFPEEHSVHSKCAWMHWYPTSIRSQLFSHNRPKSFWR